MTSEEKELAIGIDLGSTLSSAAVLRKGVNEIIPDYRGNRLIPSNVYYNPINTEVEVGGFCDQPTQSINQLIIDVKRIIGRKYDDAFVQKLINSDRYRFSIVRGEDNGAAIQLRYNGKTVKKTPEEISSEILKYLRKNALKRYNVDIKKAVISIPARFSTSQRKATKAAASLAGFEVLRLISEPVAAAVHYRDDQDPDGILMVIDLGGGTLDISIVDVKNNKFNVKNIEGDTSLGGADFDHILANYIKKQLKEKHDITTFEDRFLYRLNRKATKAKERLSFVEEFQGDLTFPKNGITETSLVIKKTMLEELIGPLLDHVLTLVTKCIEDAGLSKEDITDVLLVGGSTRIPKLQAIIRTFFNKEPKIDTNPDEAVALGASKYAAFLMQKSKDYEEFTVTERTPLFLGYELCFGRFFIAIPKNSQLPFKSEPSKIITVRNNQSILNISVYEGLRKNCQFNNFLGSFDVKDLPLRKAGDVVIQTIFSLDEDGILTVEAWDISSDSKKKLTVTSSLFGSTDYKTQHKLNDANKNKIEDDVFHTIAEYKSRIQGTCEHIQHAAKKIQGCDSIIANINRVCENMKEKINESYSTLDLLRVDYAKFCETIKPYFENNNLNIPLKTEEDIFQQVLRTVREYNATFYGQQTRAMNSEDRVLINE